MQSPLERMALARGLRLMSLADERNEIMQVLASLIEGIDQAAAQGSLCTDDLGPELSAARAILEKNDV